MRQCPHCSKMLEVDTGITRDRDGKFLQSEPQPGDVTICCSCGEFCEFGPDNTLLKISEESKLESLKDNPDARMAYAAVQALIKEGKTGDYEKQVKGMAVGVRDWCRKNPTKSPAIQRNATSKVGIIATLTDSIKHKYVSVNQDAMDMLIELGWLNVGPAMPTVFMAEMAMELAFKDSVD